MHMQFSIPEANLVEFKASAKILMEETAKEEGSTNFFFSSTAPGEGEANTFTLYEEWASDEALAAHKEMQYFANEFTNKVQKYVQ